MRAWWLATGLLVGCQSPALEPYPGNSAAGTELESGDYRIQRGDLLRLRYPLYSQWNAEVLVRPDGRIAAPLAGELIVEELTLEQTKERIASALVGRIRSTMVEVDLVAQRKGEVYVGGEVVEPGVVSAEGSCMTLDQALAAAGGTRADTARLDAIVIVRVDPQGVRRVWQYDYEASIVGRGNAEAVMLLAGDVVLVPNTTIDQVNNWVEQHISRMIPSGGLLGSALILRAVP